MSQILQNLLLEMPLFVKLVFYYSNFILNCKNA